jgi:hypothetical protein
VKDDVWEKTQNVIGLDDRAISKVANLVETPAWHAVLKHNIKATSLGSPVVPSRLAPRAAMSLKQTFAPLKFANFRDLHCTHAVVCRCAGKHLGRRMCCRNRN